MKLNKSVKNCVKSLVRVDSKILEKYLKMECGDEAEPIIDDILLLTASEKKLIEAMKLDLEKMESIKKYFQGKLRLNLDEDLIKLSLSLNDKNYPYFRAYARIYYAFCYDKMLKNLDNKSIFIDQEVLNLYRLLNKLALQEDSIQASFYSKLILLNSPQAEDEILRNGLKPVVTYDAVEFASELYIVKDLIIKRYEECSNIIVSYDRIKRATLSRKTEFDKIFHEMLSLLLANLPKYATGDIYFKMLCCYFETIFTLLDPESREYIYQSIDNSKVLHDPEFNTYGFLEEYLPSLEQRIDQNLSPYNKHLSLFNF